MSSEVLILLIFLNVATLGLGRLLPVINSIALEVSLPEILITAIPEIPGPDDKAKIVIKNIIALNGNKLYIFIMIIWLASYPKSGNTWMRAIISALVYSEDGLFNLNLLKKIDQFPEKKYLKDFVEDFSDFNSIKRNWIIAQDKINLDNNIKFFKTHQGKYTVGGDNFTNNENTKAVIYIVRDPRNVVTSISNHFTFTIEKSLKFMLSSSVIGNKKSYEESLKDKESRILTLLGKWNDHYRSWTRKKSNFLLIKYEDLILNPTAEIKKVSKFLKNYLKFEITESKIQNIVNTTTFENLKKLENEDLFNEGVLNKKTNSKVDFFNMGPKNTWEEILDKKISQSIEDNFSTEMKELGYLKQI